MKAFLTYRPGGIEELKLEIIDAPVANSTEVVVDVKAISINPVDVKVKYADEGLAMVSGQNRPIILGWDVAGVISEVGSTVGDHAVGDRVFGMVNFPGHGKAYAEKVAVPADQLAIIPDNVNFQDAAATTLAALTALQVLKGKIQTGHRVLVHAGSGGVGHFAIQIAKSMGAFVAATSSAKNKNFLLGLGVNQHVDYRSEAFEDVLTDFDFVFDTLGLENATKSLKVLKSGGHLTSIATMGELDALQAEASPLGITAHEFLVHSNGADMQILAQMLGEGTLRPNIDKTFAFEDLPDAHTEVEAGRTVGKVIVTLGE